MAGASLQLESCKQAGPITGRAQCGRLVVAENPDNPQGRQIHLNIVRIPAIASSPQPDPLFVFAGGPGEAATKLVDRLPPLFRKINRQRDLVFVDQRGTGDSNPLNCSPAEPLDLTMTSRESVEVQLRSFRKCLASYDADLRFYTTPYAMDDMDAVRRALGYRRINVWGGSYGTRAALVYMRRHPEALRAAVLDGLAPFAIQLPYHALADADAGLRRLFALCEGQSECHQRFPDLAATTRRLIAELDREPRLVEMEHPLSQEATQVRVSGQLLAALIRLALYQRDLGPIMPLAIDSASKGDFGAFSLLLTAAEDIPENMSLGLQQTILCVEDIMRPAPQIPEQQSILQLDLLASARAVCEFWPKGKLPENYFAPVQSQVPTLLISGELDPVTPPRWGDEVGQSLTNSLHVRVPGAHHIASHAGCLADVIAEFVEEASVEDLNTDCVADIAPLPPFVSPAGPAMMDPGDGGVEYGRVDYGRVDHGRADKEATHD